jgi:hypothetical protein
MPGYGRQRTTSSGPGSSSGSYSGVPGMSTGPGAPGQPQGIPSAQPQPVPTGQPPLGSDMAMLGGAITIDTRNIRRQENPLWSNPLFWPFAVVAWPFMKVNQAVNADRDEQFRQRAYQSIEQQTGVPISDGSPRMSPPRPATWCYRPCTPTMRRKP